jgi:predicted dehydrogenase
MKPKFALIGCGRMSRVHAKDALKFDGIDFVAASDPVEAARAEMKKVAPGIRLYADTDEMLAKEKPEMALVGTTALTHARLSLAALRAGAHVLCEKPFMHTLAEADEVIATARKLDRMLLVDHQFRINPRTLTALKIVRDGGIGKVRTILTAGKGRYGGWELLETGTHLFDLAFLFAGKPQWVCAHLITDNRLATADDIVDGGKIETIASGLVLGERAHVTIGFANGIVLRCELIDTPSTNFLQFAGTEGLLHVPLGAAKSGVFQYPKTYVNPNVPTAAWREIPVEWSPKWGEQHNLYTFDLWTQWLANPKAGPQAIDDRHPMDAEWGRQSLEVIHGAIESHFQNGARINIPLKRRDHPLTRRMKK